MGNETVKGRRVPLNKDGFFVDFGQPGDFGRIKRTIEQVHGLQDQLYWQVIAPDGSSCKLSPEIHEVFEHSDGSISVTPSIVTKTWHGWLVAGVWKAV